jgi:hypothetical protein
MNKPEEKSISGLINSIQSENESANKRIRIPSGIKTFIGILLSFAILAYYFQGLDWQGLKQASISANLPLAVAGILFPHKN